MDAFPTPQLTWNVLADVRAMLQFPFMVQAFRAGVVVAVLAGVVGWFMVLRRQTFAGHTLALVGLPGATLAVIMGVSSAFGFVGFSLAAAIVLALLPAARGTARESAVVGTVQASALALGFLFYSWYGGFASSLESLLFGSFLGITSGQVVFLALITLVALLVVGVLGRPLFFATVDPDVAAASGVPVRWLGFAYLLVLGLAAGAVSQVTGALLVFALLVAPAAAAQRLTIRPGLSLVVAVAIGLAVVLVGLTLAFYYPYPLGTFVTSLALLAYVVARLVRR